MTSTQPVTSPSHSNDVDDVDDMGSVDPGIVTIIKFLKSRMYREVEYVKHTCDLDPSLPDSDQKVECFDHLTVRYKNSPNIVYYLVFWWYDVKVSERGWSYRIPEFRNCDEGVYRSIGIKIWTELGDNQTRHNEVVIRNYKPEPFDLDTPHGYYIDWAESSGLMSDGFYNCGLETKEIFRRALLHMENDRSARKVINTLTGRIKEAGMTVEYLNSEESVIAGHSKHDRLVIKSSDDPNGEYHMTMMYRAIATKTPYRKGNPKSNEMFLDITSMRMWRRDITEESTEPVKTDIERPIFTIGKYEYFEDWCKVGIAIQAGFDNTGWSLEEFSDRVYKYTEETKPSNTSDEIPDTSSDIKPDIKPDNNEHGDNKPATILNRIQQILDERYPEFAVKENPPMIQPSGQYSIATLEFYRKTGDPHGYKYKARGELIGTMGLGTNYNHAMWYENAEGARSGIMYMPMHMTDIATITCPYFVTTWNAMDNSRQKETCSFLDKLIVNNKSTLSSIVDYSIGFVLAHEVVPPEPIEFDTSDKEEPDKTDETVETTEKPKVDKPKWIINDNSQLKLQGIVSGILPNYKVTLPNPDTDNWTVRITLRDNEFSDRGYFLWEYRNGSNRYAKFEIWWQAPFDKKKYDVKTISQKYINTVEGIMKFLMGYILMHKDQVDGRRNYRSRSETYTFPEETLISLYSKGYEGVCNSSRNLKVSKGRKTLRKSPENILNLTITPLSKKTGGGSKDNKDENGDGSKVEVKPIKVEFGYRGIYPKRPVIIIDDRFMCLSGSSFRTNCMNSTLFTNITSCDCEEEKLMRHVFRDFTPGQVAEIIHEKCSKIL